MSDAKAKAEARRAKILAREKSKTVSPLVSEEDSLYMSLTDTKGKERPLAARKSLIAAKTEEENKDEPSTPVVKAAEETEKTEGGADEGTDKSEVKSEETKSEAGEGLSKNNSTTDLSTPSTKEKKVKFPPAKTLEEIEREVAENTKKFDERVTGVKEEEGSKKNKKTEDKEDETKSEKSEKSTDKGETKPVETKKEEQLKKFASKVLPKYTIEPSTAMRFLRLFLIIAIAAFTGFRIVQKNRLEAVQQFQRSNDWNDEFDLAKNNFDTLAASTEVNRTWLQYFQSRITGQFETALSAVMMIYWVSKMCTPFIDSAFKVQKQKQSNMVQMVLDFVQTGLSGWLESVYTFFGEVALYFFMLLFSVVMFTLLYADSVNVNNMTSNADVAVNNEL